MKLHKLLLSAAIVAVSSLLGISAYADEPSDYTYRLLNDGTAELTAYIGQADTADIPAELDGYKLTSINYSAFSGNTTLKAVIIPEGVTTLKDGYTALDEQCCGTFLGCSALSDVTLPESLTNIGAYAFAGCEQLAEIHLPDSVTAIGSNAFYGCTSLSAINIPDGVARLDEGTFIGTALLAAQSDAVKYADDWAVGCDTDAEQVQLKDGTRGIAGYTFKGCAELTSIEIPDSVHYVGEGAFYGCKSLKSAIIPNGVTSIARIAFVDCSALSSVVIPDSVTELGVSAFMYCTSLRRVVIPDNVKIIYDNVFYGCSSLSSVVIPKSVEKIVVDAFRRCPSLSAVYCREEREKLLFLPAVFSDKPTVYFGCNPIFTEDFDFVEQDGTLSVTAYIGNDSEPVIPAEVDGKPVTKVRNGCFGNNAVIKAISVPASVTEFGSSALGGCTELVRVNYSGSSSEWNDIVIAEDNAPLLSANVIFGAVSIITVAVVIAACLAALAVAVLIAYRVKKRKR